jgi:hypothetical protein
LLVPADLRGIVAAYTLSKLATWFGVGALTLTVYSHTHSAVAVAAVLIVPLLPALLAPAVVAGVEASPRRGALSALNCVQAGCAGGVALLLWHFWLPGVMLLVALNGAVANAAGALLRSEAARRSANATGGTDAQRPEKEAPGHDRPADAATAHSANAALNTALALTGVTGPALAGVTVEALGGAVAMGMVAVAFAVCAVLVRSLRPYVEELEPSVWARLGAVRAHLRSARPLRNLLITQALALVFFESGFAIEIVYARSTLGVGDSGWGALVGVWGVGMIVGSVIFARSHRHLWTMLTAGTFAVGAAYVGFAAAPSLPWACAAALVGGVGNGMQWASLLGAVQRITPARLLGRTLGAVEAIGSASPAVGLFLGGTLTAFAEPRVAFLVMGLGACAMTLSFMRTGALAPQVPNPEAPPQRPPTGTQITGATLAAATPDTVGAGP